MTSDDRRTPTPPSLDIVIVNWNAGRQLETVLRSIAHACDDSFTLSRVVIVDNGSTDGSLELPALELPVHIIRNGENRGFAAACNQGARAGDADAVLLLNPDTELATDSLAVPMRYLFAPDHADVGVVGIQLVDDEGHVARSCARCPTPSHFWTKLLGLDRLWPATCRAHVMEEWPHDATRPVDHVIGAFYLVRRTVWTALDGLDERFFVYLEDIDFSCRARRAGWHVMYLTEARARHTGGGTSEQVKPMRLALALESRMRYGRKHFSVAQSWLLAAATLGLEPWIRFADALRRGDWQRLHDTARGYRMLWQRLFTMRGRSASSRGTA